MKNTVKKVLRACLSKPQVTRKDIHAELAETITERRMILPEWERLFMSDASSPIEKGIHTRLAETIAAYKKAKQVWERRLFATKQKNGFAGTGKKAA